MTTSTAAVMGSSFMGKIRSFFGYLITIIFGYGTLSILWMPLDASDLSVYIFFLIMTVLGIWLIISGAKAKRRVKRIKLYASVISDQHKISIRHIADATSLPLEFVKKDLQTMINKKFLPNTSLNLKTEEIIFGSLRNLTTHPLRKQEMESVNCPGCGANNSKQKGSSAPCEYCGITLK